MLILLIYYLQSVVYNSADNKLILYSDLSPEVTSPPLPRPRQSSRSPRLRLRSPQVDRQEVEGVTPQFSSCSEGLQPDSPEVLEPVQWEQWSHQEDLRASPGSGGERLQWRPSLGDEVRQGLTSHFSSCPSPATLSSLPRPPRTRPSPAPPPSRSGSRTSPRGSGRSPSRGPSELRTAMRRWRW